MRAALFVNSASPHQEKWCGAFLQGLVAHGMTAAIVDRNAPDNGADIVAVWSVRNHRVIESAKRRGATVVILEAGYIDRHEYASVSIGGGLNGRGRFVASNDGGERFDRLWGQYLKPWCCPTGYALICGQVPGDMSVQNVDLDEIYVDIAAECREIGVEPVFRHHPKGKNTVPPGVRVQNGDLESALAGAHMSISWNSNSGVDAILAGVPTVALDCGSMVWDVTSHEIEIPPKTDRAQWAADLAWKQWSLAEIASGAAWEHTRAA